MDISSSELVFLSVINGEKPNFKKMTNVKYWGYYYIMKRKFARKYYNTLKLCYKLEICGALNPPKNLIGWRKVNNTRIFTTMPHGSTEVQTEPHIEHQRW